MVVLALIWPFCYFGISNIPYLLLTIGHFTNRIFTHRKYTHMETQIFKIVAYQCLDFSSITPKGKNACMYIQKHTSYKTELKINRPFKARVCLNRDVSFPVCSPWAAGRPLVNQKCSRDKKPSVAQLPLPAWLPWLLKGPGSTLVVPGSPDDFP